MSPVNPVRLAQFAATTQQLASEREAASRIVEGLLRKTPRTDWATLATHPDLSTCGALERLGNLFAGVLTTEPLYAHAIAHLAVSIADGLPENTYPKVVLAQIRALAWKDLGKALRFLGRNPEAIQAFQEAEQRLDNYGVLSHDRAIVRFNCAMSLQEIGRYDESRALIVESKEAFRVHGDTQNVILCGLAEGVLLQRLRRYREARESYLLLLASSRDIDTESVAAIHHAIGFCSVELDDFVDAEANLLHAISLYRQIGQPISLLKAELGRGRLLIRQGAPAKGVIFLRPIRRQFLAHGLHEEAGLCGLEIVEALLLLGRASEAQTLARKIVGEFTVAKLNTRAITALGYLAETISAGRASPSLAGEVRDYILSLRAKPEREFLTTN